MTFDPSDDPATSALHRAAGILMEVERAMQHEPVRVALETQMLHAGRRIEEVRKACLVQWSRRCLANGRGAAMSMFETPQGERRIIISDIHVRGDVSVKGRVLGDELHSLSRTLDFETTIPIDPRRDDGNMDIAQMVSQLEVRLAQEVARKLGILPARVGTQSQGSEEGDGNDE